MAITESARIRWWWKVSDGNAGDAERVDGIPLSEAFRKTLDLEYHDFS